VADVENQHPKISILIAEDDKEIAESLDNILTERDYEVTVAFDGEAAVSKLKEKNFDVMILDLKLPKVGGFEILGYIRNNKLTTKVIVLTAYADIKNAKICKNLGAEHVIGKPYDIEMLFWAIDMVTAKRS
jgi:two-component system, NtrC family, response regulator HydG